MEFSRNFRSLIDISGNFISMEFSGIPKLVESSKFLKHRVDIGRNLRLIDFSGFLRFQFRVKMVHYRTFLLVIRGGK
jgi:hypothetical protein